MTVNNKIATLIGKLGLNPDSFASEVGLSSTAIYNIIGPKRSKPGHEFYEKVKERWPHIDLNVFFSDEIEVENSSLVLIDKPTNYGPSPGKIPIINLKTAANSLRGIEMNEPIEHSGFLELPKEIVGGGTLIALPVKGTSMQPVVYDGSYVILRLLDRSEWDDIRNGQMYMVYSDTYGSQLKYVRRSERNPDLLLLESENIEHETVTLNTSEVFQIWQWRVTLGMKWVSLKKSVYDRLDRLEIAYKELSLELNGVKERSKQIR